MNVRIDKDMCTGCGLCVDEVTEIFEMHDDGYAIAKVTNVPSNLEQNVDDAADNCPVEAIIIE